jgi:hypothetical protein
VTDTEREALQKSAESSAGAAIESAEAEELAPLDSLDTQRKEIELEGLRDDVGNKDLYAKSLLGAMAVQLVIVDVAFGWYAFANHWHIPTAALNVWIGGTFAQVVGVVLVVAHYLFPNRDGKDAAPGSN